MVCINLKTKTAFL